ncbi:MAG: redoxin family protein [Oligoflexia bacterium]|nr:redoxin family protein [Oligoflexia bacterium]
MKLFCVCLSFSFIVSCIHRLPSPFLEESQSVINKQIRDITFWPLNGLSFRLSELKERKAFVIVMREKDCPISEKYGGRLKAMEEEYSKKGIQFIYVYVGQVRPHEMARADLKNFGFKSFYVVDLKQRIINTLSAQTTGDVFILNSDRRVIYKGPLDDQYHVLKRALRAKNHYVREVLDNLLRGKEIKPRELPAPGCIISRPVLPEVVYWKDVAPIVRNKCTSCHNPKGIGPMNFVRYEDVAGRGRMFEHVIRNDLMPPWYLADNLEVEYDNDLSLGIKEKALLLKWANTGFKKGKSFKNKTLWVEKLEKREFDYMINLPKKVVVPEGKFLYYAFLIDPKFKEDKWIKHIYFVMKPKVVHHAVLFIMKPDFDSKQSLDTINLYRNQINMAGLSLTLNKNIDQLINIKIPAQHKLVLEIHYEAQGKDIVDDYSHVKIKFYKKPPKHQLLLLSRFIKFTKIHIPPNESNYHIETSFKTQKQRSLVSLYSHMHLRGKRTSFFIVDSKGNRKRIFGLDPWSVLFERSYFFLKPIPIPKNHRLEYHWWYDNSTDNIFNPDPNKEVLGGFDVTESEMAEIHLRYQINSYL